MSAPHLKTMLATSFARALSEVPKESVIRCWEPLQRAIDDQDELHTQAKGQLERLFPNGNRAIPDAPAQDEPEPDPVVHGDDFGEDHPAQDDQIHQ